MNFNKNNIRDKPVETRKHISFGSSEFVSNWMSIAGERTLEYLLLVYTKTVDSVEGAL